MIRTDPDNIVGAAAVVVMSDAPDNEAAIREINAWARANGLVRTREYHLNRRQTPDGKRWYVGTCLRMTDDDVRAADADLREIRNRREQMPVTAPADALADDEGD